MQTTVTASPVAGIVGDLADAQSASEAITRAVVSGEASASIPFGRMVVDGTGSDDEVKLPAAQETLPAGIVVFAQNFRRANDGDTGQLDANGLTPGTRFAVLRVGEIWVEATETIGKADEVHYQAEASATPLVYPIGCFRKTSEAGKTVDISPLAEWLTHGVDGDPIKLSIDLRNRALMTSD